MHIDVSRPDELRPAELGAWHALQDLRPELGGPFLGPEFALAVARVRGDVRVARLREGAESVGFFAFQLGRFGIGRPLAAGISDAQGVVAAPGVSWDAERLLEACGLAVIEFDHLIEGQSGFEAGVRRREPSPVIDVSGGFDAYVAARRSSRSFRRVQSRRRELFAEHPGLRFDAHRADPETLATLLAWKSAQYRRTGRADRFARRWIRRLVVELMGVQSARLRGVVAALMLDGRPIAIQAGLATPSVLALWFPAYAPGFERFSPGNVLRLELAGAAAQWGITCLDMGKGHSVHKEILKTGEHTVGEALVMRPAPGAWLYRGYREPPRALERFVLDHPRLRVGARRVLRELGTVRTRAAGRGWATGRWRK